MHYLGFELSQYEICTSKLGIWIRIHIAKTQIVHALFGFFDLPHRAQYGICTSKLDIYMSKSVIWVFGRRQKLSESHGSNNLNFRFEVSKGKVWLVLPFQSWKSSSWQFLNLLRRFTSLFVSRPWRFWKIDPRKPCSKWRFYNSLNFYTSIL